jgi:hypothetical protein
MLLSFGQVPRCGTAESESKQVHGVKWLLVVAPFYILTRKLPNLITLTGVGLLKHLEPGT